MRIRKLQGTWDARERKGPGVYIGDQTYIEMEIDGTLASIQGEDLRISHTCTPDADFWVHQYPDESLITFIHHNSAIIDSCDFKPVGHKDHTMCGFAGSTSEYTVNGVLYKVVGGWTSNENHYNEVTGKEYVHCAVFEKGRLTGWGPMYIPLSTLIKLIKEQKFPYKLVRGLGVDINTIEVVHVDDVEKFIAQGGMWNPASYSRTGTRWASQYSDIEGPSKYRTRYIKDDIKNAQVLN